MGEYDWSVAYYHQTYNAHQQHCELRLLFRVSYLQGNFFLLKIQTMVIQETLTSVVYSQGHFSMPY